MKIASWNTNCNWNTRNASWKVDLLLHNYPEIDGAFLMEHPYDRRFVNYAAVVARRDVSGVYAEKKGEWNDKDNRGVGFLCPDDAGTRLSSITSSLLVEPSLAAFVCGYEIGINGKSYRVACLWNYPRPDAKGRRDYLFNCKKLINYAGEFLAGHNGILLGDFNITAFHERSMKDSHANEKESLEKCFNKHKLKWLDADKKEEQKQTWFMHKDPERGYAIDFCAVTHSIEEDNITLEYGSPEIFVKRNAAGNSASDHIPLIITIR